MHIFTRQVFAAGIVITLFVIAGAFITPADAHCPHNGDYNHQHCSSGDGGSSDTSKPKYDVALVSGEVDCASPIFNPGEPPTSILATTVDLKGPSVSYTAVFPRHLDEGGPTLTMDSGLQLTDDIRIYVTTNEFGQLVAVQVKGQPDIGKEALAHESEVVQLLQSVDPLADEPFTVHVNKPAIPIWQLSRHTGGKRVLIVGRFCLGDLVYTPQP